ncbi:MAG: DegT/DnrJ/EryC1/StrS family aminotransferase [bacterium]|nr:DegT/DnrJ/EryC1/StrS family aminotransferase [bacterium]
MEIKWSKTGTIYDKKELDALLNTTKAMFVFKGKMPKKYYSRSEFQRKFAEYTGAKYAVAVTSCGTALDTATKVLGIKEGDEVITTPQTFAATSLSVLREGGRVVFSDIDPRTFNLDPSKIEEKITPRTKAIYVVHYAGLSVDMDPIMEIAKRHNLYVVDDAAHAIGAEYKGRKIGSIGDMTCFSFQYSKNMTTLGEGGMLTTNNDEFAKKIEEFISFGYDRTNPSVLSSYDIVEMGSNYRMSPGQAAVGYMQLDKVDKLSNQRRKIAYYLNKKLEKIRGVIPPYEPKDCKHVYYNYTVLFEHDKIGLKAYQVKKILMEKYKISTVIMYQPLYHFTLFKKLGYNGDNTPITENICCNQLLNLPIHPTMKKNELDYMVSAIKKICHT